MFIEFTFDPKLLSILLFPAFREISKIIGNLYLTKTNNFFDIFRIFLSFEFSCIFLLIFKCKNKSNKKEIIHDENENKEEKSPIILLYDERIKAEKKNKTKSILFLFLLSLLYFGSYMFNYYTWKQNIRLCRNSLGVIYEIIILYVLSLLILKEKYYKHHYLSIAPICISLIILFIIYLKILHDPNYSIYNAFWYYLVYYSLYCSFDILLKKYFLVYFYSIYFVILMIGANIFIPLLIYDIIAFYINKDASGIIIGLINNVNSVKNAFLFIADLLLSFITNLGIFWTIYYFTPFHLIICEFISEIILYYVQLVQFKIKGKTNFPYLYERNNIIIFTFIFFINLICSLIFNEIIILKFCKLEFYTKKYIKDRADSDASSLFIAQDTINSDGEIIVNDN